MRLIGILRTLGISAASGLLLAAATSFPDPQPAAQPTSAKQAVAVLAGGCFWGLEGVYEHTKGVTNTLVGYSGGSKQTAVERVLPSSPW